MQRYRVWPGLAWEEFPDEIVAIDLERGIYFNLGGGGADAFRAFSAGVATVDDVVQHLAPAFDAPREALAAAVAELVKQLVDHRLLAASDAPATPLAPLPAAARPLAGFVLDVHADLQELVAIDPIHDTADEGWPAKKP